MPVASVRVPDSGVPPVLDPPRVAELPGDPRALLAALGAVYLIWGSTYLANKVALVEIPPLRLVAIRYLLAGGLAYAGLRLAGRPAPTLGELRSSLVISLFLIVGGAGGVVYAQTRVASGLTALVVAVSPLWTALFAGLLEAWPTRREWAGLLVGFAGILVLNADGDLRVDPVGLAILLAASGSWALGSMLSRRMELAGGFMGTATGMLAGGAILAVLGLGVESSPWVLPSPRALAALAYLVVFGSMVAFAAYLYLLHRVRPALAASYAYVNPIVALLLGAWIGGEPLDGTTFLAMILILGGVGVVVTGPRR